MRVDSLLQALLFVAANESQRSETHRRRFGRRTPISATVTCAAVALTPGIVTSRSTAVATAEQMRALLETMHE